MLEINVFVVKKCCEMCLFESNLVPKSFGEAFHTTSKRIHVDLTVAPHCGLDLYDLRRFTQFVQVLTEQLILGNPLVMLTL